MSKLPKLQMKAFEQILTFMKMLKYEQVPPQVIDELKKHGIVKEENETMEQFVQKIKDRASEINK